MKSVLLSRFGGLPSGELVQCDEGKYRYFKSIRLEMYRALMQ